MFGLVGMAIFEITRWIFPVIYISYYQRILSLSLATFVPLYPWHVQGNNVLFIFFWPSIHSMHYFLATFTNYYHCLMTMLFIMLHKCYIFDVACLIPYSQVTNQHTPQPLSHLANHTNNKSSNLIPPTSNTKNSWIVYRESLRTLQKYLTQQSLSSMQSRPLQSKMTSSPIFLSQTNVTLACG